VDRNVIVVAQVIIGIIYAYSGKAGIMLVSYMKELLFSLFPQSRDGKPATIFN